MQRQFTSGSRQAPDPFDQYLEKHNFYRKHTARDASCLFRTISEQMYDTQMHHLLIRKRCVRYMRKHYEFFQQKIDKDLNEYLDDLSKPKTYGSLIELQAVGHMFQRSVILFEPYDLGNLFISHANSTGVIRVFYTPERHFDSVFTSDYIKDVAVCQSICYGVLYKDLFKLPDVSYAVEHMLHPTTFEGSELRSEYNEDGYCTRIFLENGRVFEFDLPDYTNCILENYKLCHFHHKNFTTDQQRRLKVYNNCYNNNHNNDKGCKSIISNEHDIGSMPLLNHDNSVLVRSIEDSVLPQKHVSCVRQLLDEGITPFPYKVAKALDPDMYRNIEFDSWNEARKESKMANWYYGDTNFKVGAKCHVQLRKSENDLYICHIQEMAVDKGYCLVFIEQLGEKRLVPYESLTPLPPDQFKPWSLPFRFRQLHKCSSVRLTRHYNYNYNYRLKLNRQFSSTHSEYCGTGSPMSGMKTSSSEYCSDIADMSVDGNEKHYAIDGSCENNRQSNWCFKLKEFTQLENFHTQTVEYCTMPLSVEHHGKTMSSDNKCTDKISDDNEKNGNSTQSNSNGCGGITDNCNNEGGSHEDERFVENDGINSGPNEPYNAATTDYHIYQVPFFGGVAYGTAEDYVNYGYDGTATTPTLMMPMTTATTGNAGAAAGGFYYMCQQNIPPALQMGYTDPATGHPMFMPATINTPQTAIMGTATTMSATNNLMSQQVYYSTPTPGPYYHPAINHIPGNANDYATGGAYTGGPPPSCQVTNGIGYSNSRRSSYATSTATTTTMTQFHGRVDFDARKSVKPSGSDLPNDMTTLRYFFNLGLQYHHLKRNQESEEVVNRDDNDRNMDKIITAMPNFSLEENDDAQATSKLDTNNNSMSNLNVNSPNYIGNTGSNTTGTAKSSTNNNLTQRNSSPKQKPSLLSHYNGSNNHGHQRRFYSRNYGNYGRDKQGYGYQRNNGGGASNNNNNNNTGFHTSSQYRSHYNNTEIPIEGSNRATYNHSHASDTYTPSTINMGGGGNDINGNVATHFNASPHGGQQLMPPTTYNLYDMNANGCLTGHPFTGNAGIAPSTVNSAGVYIPIQLTPTAGSSYIYPAPPPPPPPPSVVAASPSSVISPNHHGSGYQTPTPQGNGPPQYFNLPPPSLHPGQGPPATSVPQPPPPRNGTGGPTQLVTNGCYPSTSSLGNYTGMEPGGGHIESGNGGRGDSNGCMPSSYPKYIPLPPPVPLYCATNGTPQGYWCLKTPPTPQGAPTSTGILPTPPGGPVLHQQPQQISPAPLLGSGLIQSSLVNVDGGVQQEAGNENITTLTTNCRNSPKPQTD